MVCSLYILTVAERCGAIQIICNLFETMKTTLVPTWHPS